jgi:hypothetical protein
MITRFIRNLLAVAVLSLTVSSCINDLDREPFFDVTSATVYNDFTNYKPVLAKLYAGFALTGQQGPAGRPDVAGIDEGSSNYVRTYWKLQEITTDEAIIGWNDPGLPQLNFMTWGPDNQWVRAMYYRIFYQIALANEFIRETADDRLASRGITGANLENARMYRREARFLRALSYYHALDLYGSVPFVAENDPIGAFFPNQISRENLFNYVESELLDLEDELVPARQNEYGRADQAVAWTVLTKLYLNAEVYIGQPRYTEATTYATKVINAGYELEPNYQKLFLTDNNTTNEIIFAVTAHGQRSQSYGLTTFLVNAAIGGSMDPADFGVNGGWAGLRTTKNIVNLFPDPNGTADKRGTFYTAGQQLEINEVAAFTDGYPIIKFKNVSSAGVRGSDPGGTFADTDFPMFRLADVYLMYAEAVLRGGTGGSPEQALQYVNRVRERAYGDASGNITAAQLTLPFILDERARELKWEAHRRTDLIRYGLFTGGEYLWPWKGGVPSGRPVEPYRALFPLPSSDIISNPNLTQNPGY